jgi:hypothetical protein
MLLGRGRPSSSLEFKVHRQAQALHDEHGRNAIYIALNQLNQSIDGDDRIARDYWALIVRVLHEYQRSSGPC